MTDHELLTQAGYVLTGRGGAEAEHCYQTVAEGRVLDYPMVVKLKVGGWWCKGGRHSPAVQDYSLSALLEAADAATLRTDKAETTDRPPHSPRCGAGSNGDSCEKLCPRRWYHKGKADVDYDLQSKLKEEKAWCKAEVARVGKLTPKEYLEEQAEIERQANAW